jgi:serine/threonine protein kinase/Tfp pilus assembly protein PilF
MKATMIGQTISHYKILEKLGEGGMGVVYKARDTKLDRDVALKFLPLHLSATDQDRARFLQEAQAAATLNHPNVCVIHSIDEFEGQQFIVMEYIDGEDLKTRARTGRLSAEQIADIALRIAEGLRVAHERGIIHRDIKSDNVMLTRDGQVKIMDFGLAKLKGVSGLTKVGSTVGTTAYMSPEHFHGAEITQQADLWAFGVVLYELVTGQLPFGGEHEAAIMYEVLNTQPKSVQSFRTDIPDQLSGIVSGLLQKDPARRIGSAKEVVDRLKRGTAEPAPAPTDRSIAVLYFENMSSEKESDYFCAGITEDIITDLSRIKQLKVVSRSDVLPFRNKEVNTRQVGEALRVNYVLDGSVRKSGNKIRITAQLIDVRNGFHVWADRFDRLVEDIFDLQNEVSQKIADALKVSLTESEKQSLAPKPTDDMRAYDFYMRGRELLYVRGKKSNERAIQMFENAISLDPNFAAAYAALAEACSNMYLWYDGDPQWLGKTIQMNQKALALDPNSMEAQFGIAMVFLYQKRFAEAKRTLERIIEKKPGAYDAVRWLGIIADIVGDYDSAIRHYERAAAIKPYSEEPWMHLDMTHRRKGDQQASDEAARKIIEIGARRYEVNNEDVLVLSRMAIPYARFGEKEKAVAAIRRVIELAPNDGLAMYNCACTYNGLGMKAEALQSLRRSLEIGGNVVREWVKTDPYFDSLREDPDFETLIAEFA